MPIPPATTTTTTTTTDEEEAGPGTNILLLKSLILIPFITKNLFQSNMERSHAPTALYPWTSTQKMSCSWCPLAFSFCKVGLYSLVQNESKFISAIGGAVMGLVSCFREYRGQNGRTNNVQLNQCK